MRVEGIPASPGYAEGPLFDLDRPPVGYTAKASTAEEKKALDLAISKAVSRLAEAVPGLRRGFDPCADDTLDQLRDDQDCRVFIAEGLAAAPEAETIYLDYRIVLAALEMGVDLIAPCHAAGKTVDAWTLNPDHARAAESLWHLIALKVDQITTDAPENLESLFDSIEMPRPTPQ